MKLEALKSFSGAGISMGAGEIRDIADKVLADDLLQAGYAKKVSGGKKDESKRTAGK